MIALLFSAALISFTLNSSAHATKRPSSGGIKEWLYSWCERHLVADDPTQYEGVTVEMLAWIYVKYGPSDALIKEMQKRLSVPDLPQNDRELLTNFVEQSD